MQLSRLIGWKDEVVLVVSLAWELVVSQQFAKRMEPRQRATTSWLCKEDIVDPVLKGFVANLARIVGNL